LSSDGEVAEGVRFARQAIETGNEDLDALWMGGWGLIILAGERAAGLSAIERALALNPNSALAWNFFGWRKVIITGRPQRSRRSGKECD
jgi:hypothetical protein